MPNACTWEAPLVTLRDGRQVPSDSAEWQFECLARHILQMPFSRRKDFLFGEPDVFNERRDGFTKRLGEAKAQELLALITAIFEDRKSATNNRQ